MMIRQIILVGGISALVSGVTVLVLLLLGVVTAGQPPVPPKTVTDTVSGSVSESDLVADMIEAVNPAVVSIIVTKDVPIYERYYESFDGWGFFGGFSVPRVRELGTEEQEVGGGSGFIVSQDGLIVTNRHVVSDEAARYSALLNDGTSYEVEILARDTVLDIAVLKMLDVPNDVTLTHVTFGDSDTLRLGETVVAIGNALGEFRNSVSRGVVSGLARSITATDNSGKTESLEEVIQTDAAINPGNSGGPLLNLRGEVVGVNVATSRGADNIGFALPSAAVKSIVDSVATFGEIQRPYLGVRYVMITAEVEAEQQLDRSYGALLIEGERREDVAVLPGSPADVIGLKAGDIILAIDDEEVRERDLAAMIQDRQVGDMIKLRVYRDGQELDLSVRLMKAPSR